MKHVSLFMLQMFFLICCWRLAFLSIRSFKYWKLNQKCNSTTPRLELSSQSKFLFAILAGFLAMSARSSVMQANVCDQDKLHVETKLLWLNLSFASLKRLNTCWTTILGHRLLQIRKQGHWNWIWSCRGFNNAGFSISLLRLQRIIHEVTAILTKVRFQLMCPLTLVSKNITSFLNFFLLAQDLTVFNDAVHVLIVIFPECHFSSGQKVSYRTLKFSQNVVEAHVFILSKRLSSHWSSASEYWSPMKVLLQWVRWNKVGTELSLVLETRCPV